MTHIETLNAQRKALADEGQLLIDTAAAAQRDLTPEEDSRGLKIEFELRKIAKRMSDATFMQKLDAITGDVSAARPEARREEAPRREAATLTGFVPSRREYHEQLRETRAQAEGTNSAGGYIVPAPIYGAFFDSLRAKSVVLQASALVLPMSSQTLSLPKIGTSVVASTYLENAEIVSTDMSFANAVLVARKIAALARGSNEWFADSNPSARDVLAFDISRQVALQLDVQMLTGNGTAPNMRGMVNFTGSTVTTAPITLAGIAAAIGRLEAANAVPSAIFMDPATWTFLRATAAADGRSLVQPDPTADAKRQLYGVPVYVTSVLPAGRAVVADMTQVAIGHRQEAIIKFDESRYFEFDQTGVRGILRFDIQPLNALGVEVLKAS
jgi:HK97 family phage major capsid protein